VKIDAKYFRLVTVVKAAVVALLSCSILFSLLLASSPDLHRAAHADAGHAGHQCLAVLLGGGAADGPAATAILIAFVAGLVRKYCPPAPFLPSPTVERLLPGRAPPWSFS
jgi:hypothetical protein